MAPPFVGTFWRKPNPLYQGPFVVNGNVIPSGSIVGVNPYSLMHNTKYFANPFHFRLERWLDNANHEGEFRASALAHKAFSPFAAGKTGCLGRGMAYHETCLTIAKTL